MGTRDAPRESSYEARRARATMPVAMARIPSGIAAKNQMTVTPSTTPAMPSTSATSGRDAEATFASRGRESTELSAVASCAPPSARPAARSSWSARVVNVMNMLIDAAFEPLESPAAVARRTGGGSPYHRGDGNHAGHAHRRADDRDDRRRDRGR